jgi:hypothetical protein
MRRTALLIALALMAAACTTVEVAPAQTTTAQTVTTTTTTTVVAATTTAVEQTQTAYEYVVNRLTDNGHEAPPNLTPAVVDAFVDNTCPTFGQAVAAGQGPTDNPETALELMVVWLHPTLTAITEIADPEVAVTALYMVFASFAVGCPEWFDTFLAAAEALGY